MWYFSLTFLNPTHQNSVVLQGYTTFRNTTLRNTTLQPLVEGVTVDYHKKKQYHPRPDFVSGDIFSSCGNLP
jgi:hypothetical protein